MRKHVYGKKAKPSAFAVSTVFGESSPGKTALPPSSRDDNCEDEILRASDALQSLKVHDDSDSGGSLPSRRTRKPLSRRDGNSRPTNTNRSSNQPPKCVKPRRRQQAIREKEPCGINTQDRSEMSNVVAASRNCLSESSSSSLYELCDPYVRPLVALTNEQKIPLSFDSWSGDLVQHFGISKIAEASYSEVYRLSLLDEHPTLTSADESVLKLIAIKPPKTMVGEQKKSKARQEREENMSSVEDIVSEVQLLKRMTEIPGFTNYRALHILQGRPSKPFIQAWKEWNKARRKGEKSEFPDPSRKASYEESQYWAVIEMQDAGTDVERLLEEETKGNDHDDVEAVNTSSIWASWDIFWQTVLAVAKGESEARFEHRDLHLGNICVRLKDGKEAIRLTKDVSKRKLCFTNLETTIIDYTLSRADMTSDLQTRFRPQSSHSSCSEASLQSSSTGSSLDVRTVFNPLQNQPKIFEGDSDVEYQYDIYRYMRNIVSSNARDINEPWRPFHPKTNLLWLHYVLYKLCETLQWPSQMAKKSKDKRNKKALELEDILIQVDQLLRVECLLGEEECLLSSAAELVAIALEQKWLCEEDINS